MSQGDFSNSPVRVGIGIVRRDNHFLVRRRPEGQSLAGFWEFPGGKCEAGETPETAVRRECREETGLDVVVGRLRQIISHRYEHATVELSFYECQTSDDGAEVDAATGFRWIAASDLASLKFPGANELILADLVRELSPTECEP